MAELNRERSEIGTDHLASVSPEYSLYTYLAGPLRDQVGVGDGLDDPHCTPAGESFPRTSDKGVSTVKFLLVGERGFLLVLLLSFSLSLSFLSLFLSFFLSFLFLPFTFTYSFPPFCLRLICSFTVFILNFTVFRLFRFVIVFFFFFFFSNNIQSEEHLGAAATPRHDLPEHRGLMWCDRSDRPGLPLFLSFSFSFSFSSLCLCCSALSSKRNKHRRPRNSFFFFKFFFFFFFCSFFLLFFFFLFFSLQPQQQECPRSAH